MKKSFHNYEARARIAKALAHPSRLMMLDLMQAGERSVGELTAAVGVDQSTVSKHLVILREVGMVESRKEGTTHYYKAACGCLHDFFACLESVLQNDLARRQQALKSGRKRIVRKKK